VALVLWAVEVVVDQDIHRLPVATTTAGMAELVATA